MLEQEDEILALDSILNLQNEERKIFSWQKFENSSKFTFLGQLEVKPESAHGCQIEVRYNVELSNGKSLRNSFEVTHLPPIEVQFMLPPDYPSKSAPGVEIKSPWLNEERKNNLKSKLMEIWRENENNVVLFLWYSFILEESLDVLQIRDSLDISDIVKHAIDQHNLKRREKYKKKSGAKEVTKKFEGCLIDDETDEVQAFSMHIDHDDIRSATTTSPHTNPGASTSQVCSDLPLNQDGNQKRIEREVKILFHNLFNKELAKFHKKDAHKKGNLNSPSQKTPATKESDTARNLKSSPQTSRSSPKEEVAELKQKAEEILLKAKKKIQATVEDGTFNFHKQILTGKIIRFRTRLAFIRTPQNVEYVARLSDIIQDSPLIKGDVIEFEVKKEPNPRSDKNWRPNAVNPIKVESKPRYADPSQNWSVVPKSPDFSQPIKMVIVDDVYKVLVDENGDILTSEPRTCKKEPKMATSVEKEAKTEEDIPQDEIILPEVIRYLKDFNDSEINREFEASSFTCDICFMDKMGKDCLRFKGCDHVYCRECLGGYFTIKIQDNEVKSLICPYDKCETQALPNQVRKVVSSELYTKYENKLLETTLSSMSDVVLCPRIHCQSPILIDRENSLASCPNSGCSYVFCIYCKAAYHGIQPCRVKAKEHLEIIQKYDNGTPEEKSFLEKRYGRRQLLKIKEEILSENYKDDNTKKCPKCFSPIQKSDGCNKMTCNRCSTHFCWICGRQLPRANPYLHFNSSQNECYGRLFEGVDLDAEELFDQEDVADGWRLLLE